jgi:cation diffusion facilitator CzcD-associated flavoprotein CzcO
VTPSPRSRGAGVVDHEILVVGAGFSGLGAGIKLKDAAFEDFAILEQAADLGGTWRDNTYPGVAVDIPSFNYSFSFAPHPGWSRVFAGGAEIKEYADRCADAYDLRRRMRFETTVTRAAFDESAQAWRVDTTAGRLTARYLITACGAMTRPKEPDIPGLADFEGKSMHTARWDHAYDHRGKRVAVIGTGASAVQLVPAIAESVGALYLFQRTPAWVLPKPNRAIPRWMQTLFRAVPATQKGVRLAASLLTELVMVMGVIRHRQVPGLGRRIEAMCLGHLERQVADAELREKLTPRHRFGCRRPCASDDYYPALTRKNVELVTEPIERITRSGIRIVDGRTRAIDALVLATGFQPFEVGNVPPFEVYGRGGRELGRFWTENRYQAYEGATVPAFPNLFMVPGPYSATRASWFTMVEAQTTHAIRCLTEARRRRARTIEIRQEPHDAFLRDVLRRQGDSVFRGGHCSPADSPYFDRHGDVPSLRPSLGLELWWRSRHFDLDHYRFA